MGILPLINTDKENLACALQAPLKCGHLRHAGRASSWHTTCCPGVVYNEREILAKNTWAISTKVLIMKRTSQHHCLMSVIWAKETSPSMFIYYQEKGKKKKLLCEQSKNSIKAKIWLTDTRAWAQTMSLDKIFWELCIL